MTVDGYRLLKVAKERFEVLLRVRHAPIGQQHLHAISRKSVAISRNQSQSGTLQSGSSMESVAISRNQSQSGTLRHAPIGQQHRAVARPKAEEHLHATSRNQSQSVAISMQSVAITVRSLVQKRKSTCMQSVAISRNQHAISRNHRAVARPKAEEQRPIGGVGRRVERLESERFPLQGRRVERLESERFPLQSDGSHLMREAISMQSLFPTDPMALT